MLVYQRVFINYQKVSKTDPDFELSQKCCYEFKKKHVIPIPSITKSCSNFRWFSQRRVNTNWSATGLMLVASLSPATWSDFKTVDQLPNQFFRPVLDVLEVRCNFPCDPWLTYSMAMSGTDWLEVPIPFFSGLFVRHKFQGISQQNMAKHMVLTYLHFSILEISHWPIEMIRFTAAMHVMQAHS